MMSNTMNIIMEALKKGSKITDEQVETLMNEFVENTKTLVTSMKEPLSDEPRKREMQALIARSIALEELVNTRNLAEASMSVMGKEAKAGVKIIQGLNDSILYVMLNLN